MGLGFYLQQPFAQHALIAASLISIACGLLGPFVVTRGAAFAVHGTAELAFTGAAAGLLISNDPVVGALVGSLVVATAIGVLGSRARERDSAIGVILAFGLGLGVLLLGHYHGFATEATNILFGYIYGVSNRQLVILLIIVSVVIVATAVMFRPLLFASVDPELAEEPLGGELAHVATPAEDLDDAVGAAPGGLRGEQLGQRRLGMDALGVGPGGNAHAGQARQVGEGQYAGHAEIGVGDAVFQHPVLLREMGVEDGGSFVEKGKAVFDVVRPNGAMAVAPTGDALEMDLVAAGDEIAVGPAQPLDHAGLRGAGAPEAGTGKLRKPAGDGVGFPKAGAVVFDEDGQAMVGIERAEMLDMRGIEWGSELELQRDFEISRRGDREPRRPVEQLHSRGEGARLPPAVVVAERHIVGVREPGAHVARLHAEVRGQCHQRDLRDGAKACLGVVGRPVVHDDDPGSFRQPPIALDRTLHRGRPVMGDHHHADAGIHHRSCAAAPRA